jgi:hypothetical protein
LWPLDRLLRVASDGEMRLRVNELGPVRAIDDKLAFLQTALRPIGSSNI